MLGWLVTWRSRLPDFSSVSHRCSGAKRAPLSEAARTMGAVITMTTPPFADGPSTSRHSAFVVLRLVDDPAAIEVIDLLDHVVGEERLHILDIEAEELGFELQFLLVDEAHLRVRIGRAVERHAALGREQHRTHRVRFAGAARRGFREQLEEDARAGFRIGEQEFRALGDTAREADADLAVRLDV